MKLKQCFLLSVLIVPGLVFGNAGDAWCKAKKNFRLDVSVIQGYTISVKGDGIVCGDRTTSSCLVTPTSKTNKIQVCKCVGILNQGCEKGGTLINAEISMKQASNTVVKVKLYDAVQKMYNNVGLDGIKKTLVINGTTEGNGGCHEQTDKETLATSTDGKTFLCGKYVK